MTLEIPFPSLIFIYASKKTMSRLRPFLHLLCASFTSCWVFVGFFPTWKQFPNNKTVGAPHALSMSTAYGEHRFSAGAATITPSGGPPSKDTILVTRTWDGCSESTGPWVCWNTSREILLLEVSFTTCAGEELEDSFVIGQEQIEIKRVETNKRGFTRKTLNSKSTQRIRAGTGPI